MTEPSKIVTFTSGSFCAGGGGGEPSWVRFSLDEYQRMKSVVAAARSGDKILIDLALKNLDQQS